MLDKFCLCALTMNVRESNPFLKVRTKRRDKYDVYIISFCCMEPSPDPEPARRAPFCAVEEWSGAGGRSWAGLV